MPAIDRARRNAAAETAVASMHLQVDGIRLYAYLVGSGCSVRVVGLIHRPPPLSRVPESRCARSQRRRLVAGKPRADVRTNATLRQLCYVEHASRTPGNEPSAGRNREADRSAWTAGSVLQTRAAAAACRSPLRAAIAFRELLAYRRQFRLCSLRPAVDSWPVGRLATHRLPGASNSSGYRLRRRLYAAGQRGSIALGKLHGNCGALIHTVRLDELLQKLRNL